LGRDKITLSSTKEQADSTSTPSQEADPPEKKTNSAPAAWNQKAPDGHELTSQELRVLSELKKRDREVHKHEQAHIAAGGHYVRGGASFQYETGPDGKKYAVAGEVSIDTSPEKDPEATIRKMETVRRAALAPAHPSAQDRAVAAEAQMKESQAAMELAKKRAAEGNTKTSKWQDSSLSGPDKHISGKSAASTGKDQAQPQVEPGAIFNTYA
ncbi:MAG: hypothetical protein DSZ23_01165, partial [Thermodesulfatator sp.]